MPMSELQIPYDQFVEDYREELRSMGFQDLPATYKGAVPHEIGSQPDYYLIEYRVQTWKDGVLETKVTNLQVDAWHIDPQFRVNCLGGWAMGIWLRYARAKSRATTPVLKQ